MSSLPIRGPVQRLLPGDPRHTMFGVLQENMFVPSPMRFDFCLLSDSIPHIEYFLAREIGPGVRGITCTGQRAHVRDDRPISVVRTHYEIIRLADAYVAKNQVLFRACTRDAVCCCAGLASDTIAFHLIAIRVK